MPIYEYICNQCSHKFEAMRSFSQADAPIKCNHCGSDDTHRAISLCFSKSDGSVTISTTAPAATALTADINYFY